MSSDAYYDLFEMMAHHSPLNALRTLNLTACQLTRLAIACQYLEHGDFADLVLAEAELQEMLEERRRQCQTLNG